MIEQKKKLAGATAQVLQSSRCCVFWMSLMDAMIPSMFSCGDEYACAGCAVGAPWVGSI